MTSVLVLHHSSCGHVEAMASAVAEAARDAGAAAVVKRVPELVLDELAAKSGYRLDHAAPAAAGAGAAGHDAIVVGAPTRWGSMAAQAKNLLDQPGGLWAGDRLVGKVGSVFASTGGQHGGPERTIQSTHAVLLHPGTVVVGLPYSFKDQLRMDEITGGSPYGATTLAGEGEQRPSADELEGARSQGGRHVARIAARLRG